MLFIRMSVDKAGSGTLRQELNAAHRAYFAPNLEEGAVVRVVQGGPLSASESDATHLGSLMILEAPSHADVVRFHEGDPYTVAGLYETTLIYGWDRKIKAS